MPTKHLLEPKKKPTIWITHYLPFTLWAAFILVASLLPSSEIPKVNILNVDKVVHIALYFVFSALLWRVFLYHKLNKRQLWVFLVAVCFGTMIEFAQETFTTTRHFDNLDILANTIGAVLFIALNIFLYPAKSHILD